MRRQNTTRATRTWLLLACAILLVVVALVWIGRAQRDATSHTVVQQRAGDVLYDAAFDMESGIGGFVLTRQPSFLTIAQDARVEFDERIAEARRVSADTAGAAETIDAQVDAIARWWALADQQTAATLAGRSDGAGDDAQERDAVMDDFRAANRAYRDALGRAHVNALDDATQLAIVGILGTGLVFLLLGYALVLRADRRTAGRAAQNVQFTERMLFARSEVEARALLETHLAEVLPGTHVAVLTSPDDERLARCEAFRTGVVVVRNGGKDDDACEGCAASGRRSLCTPLRVGSSAIGAVVVGAPRAHQIDGPSIRQASGQAAPVLVNLRNLAIAEEHASTDVLTGLPNRRAVDEALRMMAVQADRTARPLAALMLDVDRFKAINDRWGHRRGDAVLAAVARVLRATARASDFVGRAGGEEFVLLLPSTDRAGAARVAETVRRAIERESFEGLDHAVTASLGIAVFPEDCDDVSRLLALADRAMYHAKDRGRNRVARVGARTRETVGGAPTTEVPAPR